MAAEPFDYNSLGRAAPLPDWLRQWILDHARQGNGQPRGQGTAGELPILEGVRDTTLVKIGGAMRRQGCSEEEIYAALLVVNQRCVPPLPDETVRQKAHSVCRYEPEPDLNITVTEAPPGAPEGPQPVLRMLSTITARRVVWLWQWWIPAATLTVLDGDPVLGKSTLTLDLAARVTRGWSMPPEPMTVTGRPRDVLLLSAEDDPECTVRPRFDAAGGDACRLHLFEGIITRDEERPPILPADLNLIRDRVAELDVGLIVVDPLAAYLGSQYDPHKDADIRRCLHQLARLAKHTGAALLLLRHLNKLAAGPALYRGGGSIGIIAAARAALIVGRDPHDETIRVLAMNKSNLGPRPASLAFVLRAVEGTDVAGIDWQGETALEPHEILWHPSGKGRPPEELDRAKQFLLEFLAQGAKPQGEVIAQAEQRGIKERTLRRAKADMGVVSRKSGLVGIWLWNLASTEGGQSGSGNVGTGPPA